jgi:hypothetical protein
MSIYQRVYKNLCKTRSHLKENWKPQSGLHRHHILPKHSGGKDCESNYTYLTIREHIIAHWLLWKINGHYRDKNAFSILKGVKLYNSIGGEKVKQVIIDDITYESIGQACEKLNRSCRTIQRWAKEGKSKKYNQKRNGMHCNGIPTIINGIKYKSRKDASRKLNINGYFISKII